MAHLITFYFSTAVTIAHVTSPSFIIVPTCVFKTVAVAGVDAVAVAGVDAAAVAGVDAEAVAGSGAVSSAWILNSLSRTQIDTPFRRPFI